MISETFFLKGFLNVVKVTQSFPTLCDRMDYTVHKILQARILEWVAFSFSRGSSQPRDQTQVSHSAGRFFTSWATREALFKNMNHFKSWLNLLQCCFCFGFWFFGQEACGSLALQTGMEPAPPALESRILITGPPGKSLPELFFSG